MHWQWRIMSLSKFKKKHQCSRVRKSLFIGRELDAFFNTWYFVFCLFVCLFVCFCCSLFVCFFGFGGVFFWFFFFFFWGGGSSTGLTWVSKFKPRLPAQWAVNTHCKGPSRMEKVIFLKWTDFQEILHNAKQFWSLKRSYHYVIFMGCHHGTGRAKYWYLVVTCNVTVAIVKTIVIMAYLLYQNTQNWS